MSHESEHDQDRQVAERLTAERPLPRAGYRAHLRAHLFASMRDAPPRRVHLLIFSYAGSGLALIAVAAVGLAGLGPLAP